MENKTKIFIGIAVIVVLIAAYVMWDRQKKAKKKAEIDSQIASGASTIAGAAVANVAPDDTYDPSADVQAILKTSSIWGDKPKDAIRIIANLGTKARLAKLRQAFYAAKGQDLEVWLLGGIDPVISSSEDVAAYRNVINSLK